MKLRLRFLLATLFLSLNACRQQTPPSSPASTTSAPEAPFQTVLDSIYQAHPEVTGILLHVEAPQQKLSWTGAVGYSERDDEIPLEADQPVLIASNTKTYVATTILRLVELEKLKLDQAIGTALPEATVTLLQSDGYATDQIQIRHLLAHTSGIFDYVDAEGYMAKVGSEPRYRWQRSEQIALAISVGDKLSEPGVTFKYADTNYVLLGEIIEQATGKDFYVAMRELLAYQKQGWEATWFNTLEKEPAGIKPLAHQYITSKELNSYDIDPSFDLYGGGGLAATAKDLGLFFQQLFSGQILEQASSLEAMCTELATTDGKVANYGLGVSFSEVAGKKAFSHGGFWGSVAYHIPDLKASVAIVILERDERKYRPVVAEAVVKILTELEPE